MVRRPSGRRRTLFGSESRRQATGVAAQDAARSYPRQVGVHLLWAPSPFVTLSGGAIGGLMGAFGAGGSSVATPVLSLLGSRLWLLSPHRFQPRSLQPCSPQSPTPAVEMLDPRRPPGPSSEPSQPRSLVHWCRASSGSRPKRRF